MKRVVCILLLLLLCSCTEKVKLSDGNEYPCIGYTKEGADSNIDYKINDDNIVIAIVLVETGVVPVMVYLHSTYCPVDFK